jgi:putative two-component system response regulator
MNIPVESSPKQLQSIRPADDTGLYEQLLALEEQIKFRLKSDTPDSKFFFTEAVQFLTNISGSAHAESRINCLLETCNYFYYFAGQAFDGIKPAKLAVALARNSHHPALLRKGLTFLGVMFADTGNLPSAIECYSEALDLARSLNDIQAECTVCLNLGVALLYSAQYGEAIASLEQVLRLANNNAKLKQARLLALTNIALCSLHIEDYSKGIKAAEDAVKESDEPKTPSEMFSRVLLENNYTRLLLEVDSVDKARERVEIARHYAAMSKLVRAEIAASTAEGLYEVHAGKIDVGLSRLSATLEKARMLRSALRDSLIAMVKAYELIGQPDRALVYLRELMEHTKKLQQDNALKHNRFHLQHLEAQPLSDTYPTSTLQKREALLKGKLAEQELYKSRIEMLERLAVAAELRDDSTGEHSYRVGKLASLLAVEFGCDEETVFMLDLAGRLHDIGKIGVPDAILLKPGKLNDAERQIMRTHTTVGAELLSKSDIPHMQMAEEIAKCHHEWWDGNGYPGNASGSAIPLSARITALADVYDALTHRRPYKEPWPIDAALDEIASLKGQQFDPELTDLFLVMIMRLRREHEDLDAFLGEAALKSPFLQARSRIKDTLRNRSNEDGRGSNSRLDLQR